MAVNLYELHRPREATITVSQGDPTQNQDYSGDFVCIGATDDVELNAAIIFVAALGGGRVILLEGEFNISSTVYLIGPVALEGQGVNSTILVAVAGIEDNLLEWTPTGTEYFAVVENMRLEGHLAGTVGHGIYTANDDGGQPNDLFLDHVFVLNCAEDGFHLNDAWGYKITGCLSEFNGNNGVYLRGSQSTITDTYISTSEGPYGLYMHACERVIIHGCSIYNNDFHGILCTGDHNILSANIIYNNGSEPGDGHGLWIDTGADHNLVIGNLIHGNEVQTHGIQLQGDVTTIVGNRIKLNAGAGIRLLGAEDTVIDGNTISDHVTDIDIANATCLRTLIGTNKLLSATKLGDAGTGTMLPTVPIPLIQGTAFVSTAGEAWGWEISADTNFALGIGWLPYKVQQVVRIRVIGVALAAPGAGDYMRIQITGEGASFGDIFSTEPIDVVDHNNEEVNPQIDDAVNWVFDATDDADIGDLLGGDRLQIKVLHEGAGNGDAATNAIVDTIQVEYV